MKRLLNVDDEWLAGIQNCPPQGNHGGGLTRYLTSRRWREGGAKVADGPEWVRCGIGVNSKFLIGWIARIVMKADNGEAWMGCDMGCLTYKYVQSFVLDSSM